MRKISASASAALCIFTMLSASEQSERRFSLFDHTPAGSQTRAASAWDENSLLWFFESPAVYPVVTSYNLKNREYILNLTSLALVPAKIKEQTGRTAQINYPAPSHWMEDYGIPGEPTVKKIVFGDGIITETKKSASMNFSGGTTQTYTKMLNSDTAKIYYDAQGRITGSWAKSQIDSVNGKNSLMNLDSVSYTYNPVSGKIIEVNRYRRSGSAETQWSKDSYYSFSVKYDAQGKLASAECSPNPISYTYDAQGNPLTAGTTSWIYKDNRCVKMIDTTMYTSVNGVPKASQLRTTTYEYAGGNVSKEIDSVFSFDGTEWTLDYTSPVSYTYDSQGRVIKFDASDEFESEVEEIAYDGAGNITGWSETGFDGETPQNRTYYYEGELFAYDGGLPVYFEDIEYEGVLPFTNPAMASSREKTIFTWSGPGVAVSKSVKQPNLSVQLFSSPQGIRLTLPGTAAADLSLMTLSGKTAAKISTARSGDGLTAEFSCGSLGIARGVYILSAKMNGAVQNMRIVLQ